MPCPACGWNNPPDAHHCFRCRTELAAASPAANGIGAPGGWPPVGAPSAPDASDAPASEVRLASSLQRTTATLIDAALMLASVGVWLAAAWPPPGEPSVPWLAWAGNGGGVVVLAVAVLLLLLPAVLEAAGGTLGKRVVGIRVVTGSGAPPGIPLSLARHLFKYVVNLVLPGAWKFIDGWLMDRPLHETVTDTFVIAHPPRSAGGASTRSGLFHEQLIEQARQKPGASAAPAIDRQALLAAETAQGTASRLYERIKTVGVWVLGASLGILLVSAGWSLYQESKDPGMSEISAHKDALAPLLKRLVRHYEVSQNFEADFQQLDTSVLASRFSRIDVDPHSGLVIATLADGMYRDKRMVLNPLLSATKRKVKGWSCGSPDIPREQLPSGCHEPVEIPSTHSEPNAAR